MSSLSSSTKKEPSFADILPAPADSCDNKDDNVVHAPVQAGKHVVTYVSICYFEPNKPLTLTHAKELMLTFVRSDTKKAVSHFTETEQHRAGSSACP
jgi:hypothetical protein